MGKSGVEHRQEVEHGQGLRMGRGGLRMGKR